MWIRAAILSFVVKLFCSEYLAEAVGTANDLLRLRNTLLDNYTKDIRPVYNLSENVNVYTSFFIMAILDFDEVSGVITLRCGMILSWNDYRLKWNPADFGGIESISLHSSYIWSPRVFLLSSADGTGDFNSDKFDAILNYHGDLTVSPGRLVKSTCAIDMKKFPVDTQMCSLLFVPWQQYFDNITYRYTSKEAIMQYYTPNGEWYVDRTNIGYYTGYGIQSISILECTIYMTRRPMLILLSTCLPVILINVLNQCVFLLPASSGERMTFTLTMFLSLAVYMTLVAESMPKVSDPIARVSYFFVFAMGYSCILILLTILTLRYEAVDCVNEFPEWLKSAVYRRKTKSNKIKVASPSTNDKVVEIDLTDAQVEDENDSDELNISIGKRDVMNFIDKHLFISTLVVNLVLHFGFITGIFFV